MHTLCYDLLQTITQGLSPLSDLPLNSLKPTMHEMYEGISCL